MIIDKEKNFTPRRVIRRAGKAETIFTDHFSFGTDHRGAAKE